MSSTSANIFVPQTETELLDFIERNGSRSRLVSGATDLLPRIHRGQERPAVLVDMSRLNELRYVKRTNGLIHIGSLTTIADLSRSETLGIRYEAFRKLGLVFASPPVRNLATVGGNVAACSSSEDLIPIFLSLDADVRLKSLRSDRLVPLAEFMLAKRKTSCMDNEVLSEVVFKEMSPHSWCTFDKIGRRERVIISLVSLACTLTLDATLQRIDEVRIALNRIRGKVPERARKTEGTLEGRILDEILLHDAAASLEDELMLTSDYRASGTYRVKVATSLLRTSILHCRHCIGTQEGK